MAKFGQIILRENRLVSFRPTLTRVWPCYPGTQILVPRDGKNTEFAMDLVAI